MKYTLILPVGLRHQVTDLQHQQPKAVKDTVVAYVQPLDETFTIIARTYDLEDGAH